MKIHYGLFTMLVSLFFTIFMSTLHSKGFDSVTITLFYFFSIGSIIGTLIMNSDLDGIYYHIKLNKRKNNKAIKDALLEKMKNAKGEELDELINRIEKL